MSTIVGRHSGYGPLHNISSALKGHAVLVIAVLAAAVTCIFVPPDAAYADYFDLNTLSCLFCTLAVVSALKERRFFEWLAGKIVTAFGNMRRVSFALVFVTYFGSMIMANDMALVTFLPLGWFVLSSCGKSRHTAFVFIMQNVAANLGGMLTPFGNPQNLYLYSYYSIGAAEFFKIMALPFAVAFVLIALTCLFVKPERVELETPPVEAPPIWRTVVYFMLFALSVLIVFRVFPFYVGLAVVTVALLILEPKAFLKVDYALLLTFCAFFVFRATSLAYPPSKAPSARSSRSRRSSSAPRPARSSAMSRPPSCCHASPPTTDTSSSPSTSADSAPPSPHSQASSRSANSATVSPVTPRVTSGSSASSISATSQF